MPRTYENAPKIFSGFCLAFFCFTGIAFVVGGNAGVWSDSRTIFEGLVPLNSARYLHYLDGSGGGSRDFGDHVEIL